MAFRLSLIHVAAQPLRQVNKAIPTSLFPRTLFPATPQPIASPMMLGNQYQAQYQSNMNQQLFELCAVPKKRTSPRRKKVRAQGRWERNANTLYKNYQICLECRRAMLPQTVCTFNKNCMQQPRF